MTGTMPQVLAALAAQLYDQVPEVVVSDIILGTPPAPCLFVLPLTTTYGMAMAGALEAEPVLAVQAVVDMSEGGQRRMHRFLDVAGPDSVAAAILHDRTLGGLVGSLVIEESTGPQLATIGGISYLVSVWSVRIY